MEWRQKKRWVGSTLRSATGAAAIALFASIAPAAAKETEVKAVRDVIDCLTVAVPERLACFERSATALAKATGQGEVVVLDREAVRKTRRELFGFSVSTPALFDKAAEAEDEMKEIVSTAAAVGRNGDGGYVITLKEGGRWEQIGAGSFGIAPRIGMPVTVKRAALGSFKMKIGPAPAVKARRIG